MSSALKLWPFQTEAVEALHKAHDGPHSRVGVVLPTGSGKTVVFSEYAKQWRAGVREGAPSRVLILAHRDELVRQAVNKLRSAAPTLSVGVVKAERDQVRHPVVVASVQTLRSAVRMKRVRDVGLVVVDECFPAGTMIEGRPIEDLRIGDSVTAWDEDTGELCRRRVLATTARQPESMVKVITEHGSFTCTPNHPILTSAGWCPAGMLLCDELVISFTHDATARGAMHGVRNNRDSHHEGQDRCVSPKWSDVLLGRSSRYLGESSVESSDGNDKSKIRINAHDRTQSDDQARRSGQDDRNDQARQAQAGESGWQWSSDSGAAGADGKPLRVADRGDRGSEGRGAAVSLQTGYSSPDDDGVRRGRRGVPFLSGPPRLGPSQGRTPRFDRVVDVQILESGSDGSYGGVCRDGLVYNIEVEAAHTYLIGDGLVVHNCHHASADSYLRILEHYGCFADDGAFAVGFTATMARGDDKALGDVWQDVVYQRSIREMIRDGYLVKPIGKRVYVEDLDLSRVKVRGGDFREGDLGAALEQSLAPETIAAAYAEHAGTRQGIIFAPTVATAHLLGDTMREAGYTCATVTGETPLGERQAALADFMAGRIQILSNCMVLTEGTDLPPASCAVIARPTKNAALYIQMVGRVLRRWPGKDDALVLDVVGVSTRHALTSPVELWGDERRKDAAEDDGEVSEAPERSEAVSLDELDDYAVGEVRSVEVDLFHGSASMWLQTRRGVRFIPAGERLIALLGSQQSGCWDVVEIQTKMRGSDWIVQGVSDLSYAMAYAEGAVTPQEMTLAHRSRGWRVKVPTDRQRDQAERMGIHIAAGASSGDVSNQIATVMGSRRIDPYLQPWMVK